MKTINHIILHSSCLLTNFPFPKLQQKKQKQIWLIRLTHLLSIQCVTWPSAFLREIFSFFQLYLYICKSFQQILLLILGNQFPQVKRNRSFTGSSSLVNGRRLRYNGDLFHSIKMEGLMRLMYGTGLSRNFTLFTTWRSILRNTKLSIQARVTQLILSVV